MEAFETMKKKGKIDGTSLSKFGIDLEIREDPKAETESAKFDIDKVKER